MAPEALRGDNYNVKADIWSIGILFFEMIFGYCPYEDKTIQRLIAKIDTKPLSIPTSNMYGVISQGTLSLLRSLLTVHIAIYRVDQPPSEILVQSTGGECGEHQWECGGIQQPSEESVNVVDSSYSLISIYSPIVPSCHGVIEWE